MPSSQSVERYTVLALVDGLEYEVDEANTVTILTRQDHAIQRFFRKLKFRIPEYTRQTLDEYCSFVFLQIDGKRTVEEIGTQLLTKYGAQVEPLYERLLPFLDHLCNGCRYVTRIADDCNMKQ